MRHAAPDDVAVNNEWCASRRMSGANAVMQPASPAAANTSAADHGLRAPRDGETTPVMYPAVLPSGPPCAPLRPGVAATSPALPDDAPAMSRLHRSAAIVALVVGCTTGNNVGSPCDTDEQCGGDLICDMHEGKGTCQPAHEHPSDTEHATEAHGTTHDTHEPTEAHGTTHDETHGETAEDTHAEHCTTYCTCLQTSCSAHQQFPYADLAACETACAGFTEAERDCWSDYCTLAQAGDDAQAHYCEHASGSAGLAECE